MRRLYLALTIFIGFTLTSCTDLTPSATPTPKAPPTTSKNNPPKKSSAPPAQCPIKSPIAIQFYPKGEKLLTPYKVIAKESISKFNAAGIKRQEACIHDALRDIAASLGGDAVINITQGNSQVTGTVVAFEKKMG